MRHFISILLAITLTSCLTTTQDSLPDYTQYVDPFIGTAATGHTFPGACRPFGLIQASPETNAIGWDYCSGYNNRDTLIWGFSQTHLNGTGCMDLGDILVQPVSGLRYRDHYKSRFDKSSEKASPGYYSVFLKDPQVLAEATATSHAAYYRFTYSRLDTVSLLVDLQHGLVWNQNSYDRHVLSCSLTQEDPYTLVGESRRSVWVNRYLAFVIRFNHPIKEKLTLPAKEGEKGERQILTFDSSKEPLEVQIALSSTGIEGAKKNLEEEIQNRDFDKIAQEAKADWNRHLSIAQASGDRAALTNYYTSLYHLMIQPNNIADVDGKYRNIHDSICTSSTNYYYSTFSLWDTYRAAHPLYTLLMPEKAGQFVYSMIEHAKVQNFLPIWTLWGKENYCMIANHAVPVVVDAALKNIGGFDLAEAYEAVYNTLVYPHTNSEWDIYNRYGYYPSDLIKTESVSRTLETCMDDYAASLLADKLGKKEDAAFFRKRAENYRNLFDSTTGFMRPRYSDSTWRSPFNPSALAHSASIGGDYTEGNAWQYTWHVQHNPQGLMELFPDRETFLQKLDSLFIVDASMFQSNLSDVTGLIGQYAHGNEPSHHIAYLYTLAGRPERTQKLIRKIFDTQYKNKYDGLCGNDDCGQMSAWYLFNAMGFYPFNPANGEYLLGASQFERIELQLADDKKFVVTAENLSKNNLYVKEILLNGERLDRNYITHEEVVNGGTLHFVMKPKSE